MPRGSRLFGVLRLVVLEETKRTTVVTTLTACVIVLGRDALPNPERGPLEGCSGSHRCRCSRQQ
jgi:hypothetical protein